MSISRRLSEMRELDNETLGKQILSAKEDMFRLRFQHFTGQLDKSSELKKMRRTIARMLTIQKERALGIKVSKSETKKKAKASEPNKEPTKTPKVEKTPKKKVNVKTSKKKTKKTTKKKTTKKKKKG